MLPVVSVATQCRESVGTVRALLVDAGPDFRVYAGDAAALRLRVLSPSSKAGVPWTYSVQWGDGSVDSSAMPGNRFDAFVTHTYPSVGRYPVQVDAIDRDGSTGNDTVKAYADAPGTPEVLVGAGDIGDCTHPYAAATAALLDSIPGTVFTAGDNAYPNGSAANYTGCYASTWGRHRKRTRPALGNHEYATAGAAAYFDYFGVAAGDPGTGYYSFDLGAWHVIMLNSNIDMQAGSPQETWLRADLAAHPANCTLAIWHHPRFSSGADVGSQQQTQPLWQALYDAGADVVISAHEHNYERFAPQTPDGTADAQRGIREFVVGTGGGQLSAFATTRPNSVVRGVAHGVLKLTLSPWTYTWRFIPIPGDSFTDSGSGTCH